MGSGGTWLNATLDKGAGTPETWTLQPSVAGQDYGTVGPNTVHEVVRANKLILSLLARGSLVSFVFHPMMCGSRELDRAL